MCICMFEYVWAQLCMQVLIICVRIHVEAWDWCWDSSSVALPFYSLFFKGVFVWISVLFVRLYGYHMHAWCLQEPEEGTGSLEL